MILLIIIISSIVIIYSFWYMEEDNNRNKFIIYMILFTVSMLIFVIAYNYLLMFIGWEYVGIISFLLINYWYINNNNNKSAFKALILNKIGDISYMIFIYYFISKSTDLYINNQSIFNINSFFIIFLFFAAIAKSAQIFFHVWLGDAMAGPTPVSALLHAATMVTAGIYLLIRLDLYVYNIYIIIIAIFTIILGGISAINQYDIKKIIAYSTVSQIGYMLYGIGINNKEIAIYHLITHGFFKALLFLSAGLIIHNYYNEQDIRKYGNFIYYSPFTFILFIYGSLSIISFPYFSGYYSKEPLVFNSYYYNLFIFIFINIGCTIYYNIFL
jgi:NADH:ubiquinone oxidoreductase subunit 5 (subunit L)/multisubunit Na+/H+ antiporter MnhA subunit